MNKSELIEATLVALFCEGNVLIEVVPCLGKTLLVNTLSRVLSCQFRRIQFTPDLMPSDILGTNIITVIVTDDGAPTLADTNSFTVIVVERPVIQSAILEGDSLTLTWTAIEGRTYRLQFKEGFDDEVWQDVTPDVVAGGTVASAPHLISASPHRFYRVLVVQ